MVALAKLHMLLFQLLVWLFIKVPVRSVSAFLKTALAWLHMEVKRWLGVFVGGLFVLVAAQALIKASPPGSNWRMLALLLCLFWLVALFSAARLTMEYLSLRRVRQSQAFREIHQLAGQAAEHAKAARENVVVTAAEKTKNTPAGKAFRKNREAAAAQLERERLAAERSEAERIAVVEQAERDQQVAWERERKLEELAAMEPSPYDD